jgi:hypothetical protein
LISEILALEYLTQFQNYKVSYWKEFRKFGLHLGKELEYGIKNLAGFSILKE